MTRAQSAMDVFDACATGKGQGQLFRPADAVADIRTLAGYSEGMKALLTPVPDAHCDLKGFVMDEAGNTAPRFAVLHGTGDRTRWAGRPTGKTVAADYVYAISFDGDRISHMSEIWNDAISLRQLGRA